MTAIDPCVAEIAVRFCNEPFWSERMPSLTAVRRRLTGQTAVTASSWPDAVEIDHDYQLLRRGARDPLAHRFLVRTALIGPGRTRFELDPKAPPSLGRTLARWSCLPSKLLTERTRQALPTLALRFVA